MKKIYSLLALPVLMFAASCSSDDSPSVDYAKQVTGSYEGYTSASCAYFSGDMSAEQKVIVSEGSASNKVNISYVSSTWGTVTVTDAVVGESAEGYIISGSGKWSMGMNGNTSDYDCTVNGIVKNDETKFTFSAPSVMGGLTIAFTEGEIPASLVLPGSYAGWTDASCAYFQGMTADDQTLTITGKDDDYSIAYQSDTWGSFTVEEIKATYSDGVFTLSGDGTCKMGMGDSLKDYPCTFTGRVDVEKSSPSFTFKVPAVMGGLTITFNTGDMPSESTNE